MSSCRLSICIALPLALGLSLTTGACGVPLAVSAASYAADGGLVAASDKTSTDHVLSVITKEDCAMWRIFRGRRICTERADGEDPYDVNYAEPQREVSEDGVQYTAPLRATAGAPAVSWDPATYKAGATQPGAGGAVPAEPAVVTPAAAPTAAAPKATAPTAAKATPAPTKPKATKPVPRATAKKPKPSRGSAASGS
jgi:hypothetical protein